MSRIEIVEVERLAVVTALALLLARADHAPASGPSCVRTSSALTEQHVRVEPAERPHGEQAVVAGVRDDERDLVDVADDREQRAAAGSRHAHPRRAEHVARHLAERRGLAPDRRRRLLLPGGPGGDEQALERLRDRHGARRYRATRLTTGLLPPTLERDDFRFPHLVGLALRAVRELALS